MSVLNKAPYKSVLTHGFVLDQKGQKMSKSIGNVVNPDDIVEKYGSDVLRLWAASSNFKSDVNIGPDIIKQVAENKRKIRNTLRFIVGNLYGYRQNSQKQFRPIDLWMLSKSKEFIHSCKVHFDEYDFPAAIQQLLRFCIQDLSAFYFEILKDRLYTEPIESSLRQGAQSVLITILNSIQEVIRPLMPFLSEEIRSSLDYSDATSLHTEQVEELEMIQEIQGIQGIRANFLEWFNTKGKVKLSVKSTFQLDLTIKSSSLTLTCEDLREIFMVAKVNLIVDESENQKFVIEAVKASDRCKCPRCWTFNSENAEEVCPRCIEQTSQTILTEALNNK